MTDWCTTDYVFEGDVRNVKKLSNALVKLLKKDRGEMTDDLTTHSDWVGYVAKDLLQMDVAPSSCDGTFFCIEDSMVVEKDDNSTVTFFTSTAWEQENATFAALAKSFHLKMYYLTFEPFGRIFETNDGERKHFHEKYFLKTPTDGLMFKSEKDAIAKLEQVSGAKPRKGEHVEDFCKRVSTEVKPFSLLVCKTV